MQVKLLFTFCLCAFLSSVTKAESWLYWCVAESGCYQEVEFEALRMGVVDSNGDAIKYVYLEPGNSFHEDQYTKQTEFYPASVDPSKSIEPQWSILGEYAGPEYSYYVEMLAWDDEQSDFVSLGATPAVSYQTMLDGGHLYDSLDITTGGLEITPYVYANIPEPSSAILLLTGVAALVLKRRKA